MVAIYGALLVILQAIGLISATWFLITHRPKRWRRLQALDAMGFPAIIALVFGRGLILTISAWPVALRPWAHMAFSVATLLLVDVWMVVKLVNFRRFRRVDRQLILNSVPRYLVDCGQDTSGKKDADETDS